MNATRNVVVAYDFSEHGLPVLERALAMVARAPNHVLHFVTALDSRSGIAAFKPTGSVDLQYADMVRERLMETITSAFQSLDASVEISFFVHTRIGSPADEILGLAKEVGADLIFIGTHGYTGLKHLVMGSVAERVAREALCPVMVTRIKGYPDVVLDKVVEVPHAHSTKPRFEGFTYSKNRGVSRPYFSNS